MNWISLDSPDDANKLTKLCSIGLQTNPFEKTFAAFIIPYDKQLPPQIISKRNFNHSANNKNCVLMINKKSQSSACFAENH